MVIIDCTQSRFMLSDLFHIQQPLWLYGGLMKLMRMYVHSFFLIYIYIYKICMIEQEIH